MELLNNTSSPPINIANHQLSNPRESPSLLNSSGVMEPNNLSQSALDVTASAQIAGATVAAPQSFSERNLDLKLPLLSSSSSDSESESATNPTADTSAIGDGERASSPPPICAICLGRCKNKCFTDSCMHQFCFKCLGEWSKVKPECPLCKQNFKSIIHNVKSIHQFEEYHVQPPTVQIAHPPFEMDFQEMRIFGVVHPGHNRNHIWNESIPRPLFYSDFSSASPYSSSSTAGSISSASGSANRSISLSGNGSRLRNQYVYRGELLDLYRQDNPGAIANSGTLSQLWRRYVYDRKLYAMPVADITGRFRESSARFYRDNPSQIHRLMPWINRDVVCLLRQTQHDVSTVLESINSALTLMNILSPAFRRRLQPYLGTKTAHFIHELNNFARSPFDMIGYDRAVQYSAQTNNEEIVIEFTSSDDSTDNEHIDLVRDGSGGINNNNTTSSRTTNASINAINLTIHNRLSSASANAAGSNRGISNANNSGNVDIPDDVSLVIDLRGESDNNETASTGQATANSSNYQNGQNGGTSDGGNIIVSSAQPTVSENIELTSGSSDECEFILERKPPHLRTPEMVSLDSASDSDVVFVDESKPSNKTSFSSSEDDHNENAIRNSQNHHTTRPSTSISTRSKITALVEAKKRNHSDNLVKSEQQDAQTEIYNVGASTSAALRLSLQKRVDKSNRSEGGGTRRLRRVKYSLRNTEHQVPRRRGKHLDSESSHSSTSSSSTTSYSSFSDTSLSDSSTSSSDEEYVANLSRRRKTSSAVADSSHKRCKLRKTKNRKANDNNSYSRAKRVGKKRKISNYDYSTDDDDNDEDNGHIGKNFALVMAISERLKRQSKIKHSRKSSTHSKERKVEDNDGSEGENSWRLKAVNEPLRKRQQQRIKSSHKRDERKRQRKTSTYKHRKHYSDTNREGDEEGRNTRKRLKIDASAMSDLGTEETSKINRFDYGSSSDESDNINLIQLKTKLTAQDQQNKNGNMDSRNMNTHTTQNSNETESLVETNLELETLDTNNTNNSNDIAVTVTEATTTTVTTISEENSETHKPIPTTNTIMETNEKLDNLPSTSQTEVVSTISASAAIDKENNFIEPMVKNDLHNSSEDSNDDDDNGNNNNNNNNGNDYNVNNDNQVVNAGDQQQPVISSSMSNYVDENNHNQNCTNIENPHHYRNNVSDDDDDDDDYDDYDDGETSNNIPGKTNLNESNVFGDGTSMSTTTTDTILHEAAEQISSVAVNFYNPQQSFNTGEFADENSANTSSSNSSILSSTSSTSSSSSISSSCNTNVFMNFKDL